MNAIMWLAKELVEVMMAKVKEGIANRSTGSIG